MSTTIDSKVVEMKFDNKDFEANVKNSMSTLDKLKAKLDFKGGAAGLEAIQKASDRMDFSGVTNGIDVASVRFSGLQVAAMTAISNITTSLMNLGQNIVQTFAIQPKTDGFEEYELKMGSIQTIMASTGASLSEVNGYLDELNVYADKTIYSFADMTENIGKFTNAGVDLRTAVKAIQGVSNEAAVSGANANEASRAMYNFAQALSAGSVKLIDWKSIENANMATVEFKNELIKTALALGTVVEENGKYISTTTDANGHVSDAFTATSMFNDSLSAQWMTTDVLTTTLGRYADETTEIGKKAFASAQDVKTFSMMMDTLKESAGSGWTTTWELIFGDFEQAKSFWTDLTNTFDGIIGTISDARNALVGAVMGGGSSWGDISDRITSAGISLDTFQSKLVEVGNSQDIAVEDIIANAGSMEQAFKNGALSGQLIIDTLQNIADTSEQATVVQEDYTDKLEYFQDVVSKVWRGDYKNGQERIEALTAAGYDYYKVQDLVNKTVDGHRLTLEDLGEEQLRSIGYTEEEIANFKALAAEAAETGSSLNSLLADLTKMSGRDLFTGSIHGFIDGFVNAFKAIGDAWNEFFTFDDQVSIFRKALESVYNISQKFVEFVNENSEKITRSFRGIFSVLKLISDIVGGALTAVFKTFNKILKKSNINVLDITASIGDALVAFTEWIRNNELLQKAIEIVSSVLETAIDKFFEIRDAVVNVTKSFGDAIQKSYAFKTVQKYVSKLTDGTVTFKDAVISMVRKLKEYVEILKEWASKNEKVQEGLKLLDNVGNGIKDTFSKWFENIKEFFENFDSMTDTLDLSKGALATLGEAFEKCGGQAINSKNTVLDATKAMTTGLVTNIASAVSGVDLQGAFNSFVDFIKGIGSRLLDLFSGIKQGTDDTFGSIGEYISNINWGPIVAIIGTGGLIYSLNQVAKSFQSINDALKTLMEPITMFKPLITEATNVLKTLQKTMGGLKFKFYAEGVLAFAIAIGVLTASLYAIAQLDQEQAMRGVAVIGVFMGLLVAVAALCNGGNAEIKSGTFAALAAMFGALAVAIATLSASMYIISKLDSNELTTGIIGLSAIILAMIGLMAAIGSLMKMNAAKSGSILAFSVFAVTLGVAVNLLTLAIRSMGDMEYGKLEQGLYTVAILMLYISALIKVANTGNPGAMAGVSAFAVALGASMILMVGAIKLAGNLNSDELFQGIIVVGVLGAFLAAMIACVTHYGKEIGKVGGLIIGMSVAIGLLIGVAKLASGLSEEDFVKGAKVIGVFGSMCAALIIAISRLGGDKGVTRAGLTFVGMSIAIASLVGVCYMCSLLDEESLRKGLTAVGVIGSMMSLMAYSLKGAGEAPKTIAAMSVAIAVLVGAVVVLSLLDTDALIRSSAALGAMIVAYSVLIRSMSALGDESKKFGKVLGTIAVASTVIIALAAVMTYIAKLDPESAVPNAIALSAFLLAFAAAIKIMGSIKGSLNVSVSTMAIMVAVCEGLAVVLASMSGMGIQNGIENAVALSILVVAFSAALRVLSTVKAVSTQALAAVFALSAISLVLGAVLSSMTEMNVKDAIPNAVALSVLINALSAACILLEIAGLSGAAGIAGVGILVALIVAVGGLMLAIGELNKYIPDMQECVNNAIPILGAVGDGLGQMIGHFVGGTLESLSSHLPGIAENLSGFIANLDPFVEKAQNLSGTDFSGIKNLADAILAMASAELMNGISDIVSFFTGNSINDTLQEYGDALVNFSTTMDGVSTSGAEKAAAISPLIAEVLNSLPSEGGLKEMVFGSSSNTMSNLATNLENFGDAINKFCDKIGDIDTGRVDNGTEAAKKIAEIAQIDMPTTGGLAGMIFGDKNNTFENLASNLVPLGEAAAAFADKTAGISSIDGVDPATQIIKKISELLKDTSISSAIETELTADNLPTLCNNLGLSAYQFSNRLKEVDFGQGEFGFSLLKKLAKFISEDLKDFSSGNVSEFVSSVNTLSTIAINDVVSKFSEASNSMLAIGFNFMSKFGQGLRSGVTAAIVYTGVAVAQIKQSISSKSSDFMTIGSDTMKSLASGINQNIAAPKTATVAVLTAVVKSISLQHPQFELSGKQLSGKIASGIQNGVSNVRNAISNLLSGAGTAIRAYYSEFYNAGVYCVQGLANGMKNNSYIASQAASKVASDALSAANKKLDINSPSREFMKTGKFSVLGLAEGFIKNAHFAADAGESLGETVMKATQDSLKYLSDMQDFKMGYASLTPVVDYSGIGKFQGTLDLSASIGNVIAQPIKTNAEMIANTQKAIEASNAKVIEALSTLDENIQGYSEVVANTETAMYVDGKKLASSIAKPMNQQLGVLSKRGGLAR